MLSKTSSNSLSPSNNSPSNSNGFSSQNPDSSSSGTSSQSSPMTQNQSPVSWKTFNDRNGKFTMQYPSNWIPAGPGAEVPRGPIDFVFEYHDLQDRFAMLTIVQPPIMSPFTNATGVADVHITSQQSVFSGFNIQKQVECGNIKFNGLESCDYIATFGSADVPPGAFNK